MLSKKRIFFFWVPLAATWLMMAAEGPLISAIIARLAVPKINLAAFGVAFSLAVLVESPIIMIMSASTALVKDRDSFFKLRNFTYFLNAGVTLIMLIVIIPPVFDFVAGTLIGLPVEVAELTQKACIILLPWPGAIGFRRFYQGILISNNLTRRVAYGTIVRITSVSCVSFILYFFFNLEGAVVGAVALSVAVVLEAAATKWMARRAVVEILRRDMVAYKEPLNYGYILKFYYPLALTSILGLGVHPMVTFFLAKSRMAIESLAVMPVIISFVFIFRSMGLSFQEVGIALMGDENKEYISLRNFALYLALGASAALALVSFTPLAFVWFHSVSGLSLELTRLAILPTRILALIPGLTVMLAFMRSILVNNKRTKPVTIATIIEVIGILTVLFLTIQGFDLVGAVAASLALLTGRFLADIYLIYPCSKVLT